MITLALSKGRIFEETLPLLKAAGIEVLDDPEKSRKLILTTNLPDVRVLVVLDTGKQPPDIRCGLLCGGFTFWTPLSRSRALSERIRLTRPRLMPNSRDSRRTGQPRTNRLTTLFSKGSSFMSGMTLRWIGSFLFS